MPKVAISGPFLRNVRLPDGDWLARRHDEQAFAARPTASASGEETGPRQAAAGTAQAPGAGSAHAGRGGGGAAGRQPSILLAEDSKVNQTLTLAMLSMGDYEVEAVDTAGAAVEAVRDGDFDLVLMDVSMPDMDGFEATAKIRALPAERARVPIIAITAHAMEGDRERCLAAGMNDYLSKPVSRHDLLAKVAEWVAAPGAAADAPADVLDQATVEQLRNDTEPLTLASLIESFITELSSRLTRIGEAFAAGNTKDLSREAHSLKSMANTFGATALADRAAALEEAANDGDRGRIAGIAREIGPLADGASRALLRLREKLQS